eukprot:7387162-Prymnesium_polylepis.2
MSITTGRTRTLLLDRAHRAQRFVGLGAASMPRQKHSLSSTGGGVCHAIPQRLTDAIQRAAHARVWVAPLGTFLAHPIIWRLCARGAFWQTTFSMLKKQRAKNAAAPAKTLSL